MSHTLGSATTQGSSKRVPTPDVVLTDTLAQLLPSGGGSLTEDESRKRIKTTIRWDWFSTLLQERSKDLYCDRVHKSRMLMRTAVDDAAADHRDCASVGDDEGGRIGPVQPALGIF